MGQDSGKKRKHVNLSITEEAHALLKAQASRSGTNVSQVVEDWIREEAEQNGQFRVSRQWVKDLDVATLDRLEDYCYEHHTTPAEAVRRWVWAAKVNSKVMRGQQSLFE